MQADNPIFRIENIKVGGELANISTYKYSSATNIASLPGKLHQASVICFLKDDPNKIVIFIDDKGRPNIPGGRIEKGETPEQAAIREVFEESNCTILGDLTPIAYTIWDFFETNNQDILIWYKAYVKTNEGEINDPDKESVQRQIVDISDFLNIFKHGTIPEVFKLVNT